MNLRKFDEDEIVFKKGDEGSEMFIVMSGAVGIFTDDSFTQFERKMTETGTFGERGLSNSNRECSAKSIDTNTLCLTL